MEHSEKTEEIKRSTKKGRRQQDKRNIKEGLDESIKALSAWDTPGFRELVKQELEQLDAGSLPLQQGLSQGSHVSDKKYSVMILNVLERSSVIYVKAGVFFSGIVPGCSCADDPTPDNEYAEYCELLLEIDKATTETTVSLLPEQGDRL
jgi:hypothetical protein